MADRPSGQVNLAHVGPGGPGPFQVHVPPWGPGAIPFMMPGLRGDWRCVLGPGSSPPGGWRHRARHSEKRLERPPPNSAFHQAFLLVSLQLPLQLPLPTGLTRQQPAAHSQHLPSGSRHAVPRGSPQRGQHQGGSDFWGERLVTRMTRLSGHQASRLRAQTCRQTEVRLKLGCPLSSCGPWGRH